MIKSPVLSRLQNNDLYSFCMVMNQYLQTAITLYNPNADTKRRVSDITLPQDSYKKHIGNGLGTSFSIADDLSADENSIFQVTVDGEICSDYEIDFSSETINFDNAPSSGAEIEINWLNEGSFNSINNDDITLLSLALCWAWAIQTQNNQLDIDRQPSDSDFKLHSEGTTLRSKIDWVKHFEEMYQRELSKADWRPFFRKTR